MSKFFSGCNNLREIEINKFKANRIEDMSFMFENCQKIESLHFSKIKTFNYANLSGI